MRIGDSSWDASPTKPPPAPSVLVVDDDREIRRLLGLILADGGFEVVDAADGQRALELLAHSPFDLVLLDCHMPGMSGLEVLRRLRSRDATRALPVIVVTAADDVRDRVVGLEAGATDYIVKPFDPDEVVARIRAQLRSRDVWQQTVEDLHDERAAISDAVGRAAVDPTPEGTARIICDRLAMLHGITGAALLAFGTHGAVRTLSNTEPPVWLLHPGRPVPGPLAQYLTARAPLGAWLELGDPANDAAEPHSSPLGAGIVACAPLTVADEPVGMLLAAVDRADDERADRVRSVATDVAQIMAGLIGTRLAERRRHDGDRAELSELLAAHAFVPYFQPIVALSSATSVGFEALTRFTDGSPPEGRFLEASATGLGLELEEATLTAAVEAAAQLPPHRWLSLNVSPRMLLTGERLTRLLAERDRFVVIELSEHDVVDDYGTLRDVVTGPELDVLLSVDDAGSGFASLRHILVLEPAFIKLDRSWVHDVHCDPARQTLINGLQHFADDTGAWIVAEGVETEPERDTLIELGVEYGQGWLFGRPSPAESWSTASGDDDGSRETAPSRVC